MFGKIIQSTSVVAAMTLLSRVSGLLRDIVFANLLGDRAAADIFIVAFRMPNFFRRLSGEGAFAAAFVPVFTEFRAHHAGATRGFLQLTLGRFGLALLIACALGVIFAPALVSVMAPGFRVDAEKFQTAVDATRIAFPYLLFISLVAMAGGMLNTCGRFAAPAATPVLLNLCLVATAIWLAPFFARAEIALVLGVLLAGFVQLAFQLPFLKREKLLVRPRLRVASGGDADEREAARGAKKVFTLMLPAVFGVSVAQLNVLINTLLASFMATGSIAWLYYADRLMEFPLGVFGIALATAILPSLSKKHAADSPRAFSQTLDWAIRWVVLICIPATAALMLLAEPMIATIYFHGNFSAHGVRMAANSLLAFSLGLTALVMVKVLAPGFYARQNTKTPTRIGVISMGVNIVVSLLLFYPMQHTGLALATSVAAFANAGLLFAALRREKVYAPAPGWLGFGARVVFAALGMGALLYWMRGESATWLLLSPWSRVQHLAGLVFAGGAAYFLLLYAVGLRVKNLQLARDADW